MESKATPVTPVAGVKLNLCSDSPEVELNHLVFSPKGFFEDLIPEKAWIKVSVPLPTFIGGGGEGD